MWKGLEQKPDPSAASDILAALARLSYQARMVLSENAVLERRLARSLVEIKGRSFLTDEEFARVVPELQAAGYLKHAVDPGDKLLLLDMAGLRAALGDRGLKTSGRKEELAYRLAASTSEEDMARLIRTQVPDDLALVGLDVHGAARDALAYERAKLWLLTHTLSFMGYTQRDMRSLSGTEYRIKILGADAECPVCRKWADKSLDPKTASRSQLPPYHPGCRCDTLADIRR